MFGKIRRFLGIALIICAVVITQIPAQEAFASNAKEDFLMDKDKLSKYAGTDSSVSVSDDVKIIGEEAFANNQYLVNVNIGKNVKRIEHGAFANCTNLSKVVIPDSVKYIDSAAFSGCTSLMNVSFGTGLEEIGDAVFAGCTDLTSINIPKKNNNFKYESGVLYDDKKEHIYAYLCGNAYDTYKMPNSVRHISQYSFWGNEDLMDIYLSSNLEEIPGYSFSNCKNLVNVQIPYSVNSIDAKAFENCVSLKNVEIPESVTFIDATAFDGCPRLNIIATEGTAAYNFWINYDRSDISSSEIQDAKKNVNRNNKNQGYVSGTDSSNSNLTSTGLIDATKDPSNVEWMPSVDSISSAEDSSVFGKTIVVGGRAVFFINREMAVNELDAPLDTSSDSDENVVDKPEDAGTSVIYDSGKGGYLPKYTEVDGKIAGLAYYGSDEMEDYVIDPSIQSIGKFSFARSNINAVNIPSGVKSIGYGAFYHCDSLTDVVIPSSVESIEAYAFENTPFLENYKSDYSANDFLIVGDGILLCYKGDDSKVNIPSGVKKIAPAAFYDNDKMTELFLPDSVIEIGSDAFRECSKLSSVSGGNNIIHIGDRAFMNCPIDTFMVSESVESIGLRAIDFSSTGKDDSTKVVVFEGLSIPKISYDLTSSRLSNEEYRKDALYNCIYAVVDDSIEDFDNTVLDGNKLGFSGLIVTLEKDENGLNTGYANVKANYVFSEDVLASIPDRFALNGSNYIVKDFGLLSSDNFSRINSEKSKEVIVRHNGIEDSKYQASLSEKEETGVLNLIDSNEAKEALNKAYGELFGGDTVNMSAYEIELLDSSNTVKIDRFGKASLYITVPVNSEAHKYHVVTLDEDGQLEELKASYNDDNKSITFETNHLSYIGVYGIDAENVTLHLKDGKLIKNYRLDESPDTGDHSFPIKYVWAMACLSVGVLLILMKSNKKNI